MPGRTASVFADAEVVINEKNDPNMATGATAIPTVVEFFMQCPFFLSWQPLRTRVDPV